MLVLKHHMGDSVVPRTLGGWYAYNEQGRHIRTRDGGLSARRQPCAVQIYEHVFPDRAPIMPMVEDPDRMGMTLSRSTFCGPRIQAGQ